MANLTDYDGSLPVDELKKDVSEIREPGQLVDQSLSAYNQQDYEKCIALNRAAIQLAPDYWAAWNNLCAVYNTVGKFEEGRTAGVEALRLAPNSVLAKNNFDWSIRELEFKFTRGIRSARRAAVDKPLKVGILVIATNKYTTFIPPLFESVQQFFFRGHEVKMFVFTDGQVPAVDMLIRVEQPHMPWPLTTLRRYHIFTEHHVLLQEMDYLFYCDADMLFASAVGEEILPDTESELVGTEHPGFYGGRRGTFETNPESKAYVSPSEGGAYFAGGFNGGTSSAFLRMADEIRENIDTDSENGIVAVWHDESHLNRYFIDHPPKMLSPSYCFPEGWNLPFEKRLVALEKNHSELRT